VGIRRSLPWAASLCLLAATAAASETKGVDPRFPRETSVLYGRVPEAQIRLATGATVELSTLWRSRPLLLTLVFARCVGVCPPYVGSLARAVSAAGGAGADYDVLVLSFDPRDAPEDVRNLGGLHGLDGQPGWSFGVVARGREALERSIAFWTEWDGESGQFDHPALTAAIDRGYVVRLLAGATVPPARMREVVFEFRRAFVGTYPLPSARTPFRCFRFSPESGRLSFDWGMALLLLPGVAMFGTTACIFRSQARRRELR
jgi:cytochrome oxidase Cu insertion factor (SCO1/SenC/PrrC family)